MLMRGDRSVINLNGVKEVDEAMGIVVKHLTAFPPIKLARDLQAGEGV